MSIARLTERFALTDAERQRLEAFDAVFTRAAAHTNLVARSTLDDRWDRHYADSLQLWPLVPSGTQTMLDVGAGAGFPGLILAILAQDRAPGLRVTLADSVRKKARFLTEAIDAASLTNASATNARAETLADRYDVVTARAVTALPALLDLCAPRLVPGGTLILPKGARADEEVQNAERAWRFTAKRVKSATDPQATILVIIDPERRR